MKNIIKITAAIFLLIFAYFLISNFFLAFKSSPGGGDSYFYHVPIAKNILNGNFIFQRNVIQPEQWYPGSSEGILALFIFMHLSVNLFNIFGILLFFFVLYKFGNLFLKDNTYALIYSSSVVVAYGVFRLALVQNIDIYLASYILILIILLENPKKYYKYFLKLGFFLGMLIGSKYTGPFFAVALVITYYKSFIKYLNLKKLFVFSMPVVVFGLFWYLRNLFITGSPVYPQSIFFFKGLAGWTSYLEMPVWKAYLTTPGLVINAYVSELMIWPLFFLAIPIGMVIIKSYKIKLQNSQAINRLLKISIIIFLIYLFLPYDKLYLGIVLGVRYIFSLFAILALVVFLLVKEFKFEKIFSLILLSSYLVLFIKPYHPKLIFIYTPIIFILLVGLIYQKKIIKIITKYLRL